MKTRSEIFFSADGCAATIGDFAVAGDRVGWEAEALERWLSAPDDFAEMPVLALQRVGEYLQVRVADYLDFLFHLLVQRSIAG